MPKSHKLVLIAEVEIEDGEMLDDAELAQQKLDAFRDAILPSISWGIHLRKATLEDAVLIVKSIA